MTAPRLEINLSQRKAWLDERPLELTDDEFEGLLMLAQARKRDGEEGGFVDPEQLKARMSAGADVDAVMASLTYKMTPTAGD